MYSPVDSLEFFNGIKCIGVELVDQRYRCGEFRPLDNCIDHIYGSGAALGRMKGNTITCVGQLLDQFFSRDLGDHPDRCVSDGYFLLDDDAYEVSGCKTTAIGQIIIPSIEVFQDLGHGHQPDEHLEESQKRSQVP